MDGIRPHERQSNPTGNALASTRAVYQRINTVMTAGMDLGSGSSVGLVLMTWWGLASVDAPGPGSASRSYSLEYRAAATCPDAAAMAEAIETRTPGAAQETVDRASVRLQVELREDGTSALWIDLPEGSSTREFPQAPCAEAMASLAVIASMVLEADASERAATTQSVMERFDPTAPPTAAPSPSAEPQRALAAVPAPATAPPRSNKATPIPNRAPTRVAVSAGMILETAVASGAALGGSAGIAAWLEPSTSRIWLPRIHAEVIATLPATEHADQGDVRLQLLAGRLHLCPIRVPLGKAAQLVPCLTGDAGTLRARGTGETLNPRTRTMPWLGLGGTVRAQLALGSAFSLESWLGVRGLARGDTFIFNPDSVAYEVPNWSVGAGLGLAITLP